VIVHSRIGRGVVLASAAVFVVVALAPVAVMVAGSVSVDGGLSAAAYRDVLRTQRQWTLLGNSVGLAVLTAVACTALGLTLGLVLTRIRVPLRGLLVFLFAIPLVVPPYVFAMAWIHLLGQRGAITAMIAQLFGLEAAPFTIYGLAGAVFVLTLCYYPVVVLTTAVALVSADVTQEEAGRLYGGWRRALTGITLRQALPGCLAGGILVFVLALGSFGVPSLLRLHVYALESFTKFNAFYDMAGATAASMPLVVLSLGALFGFERYRRRLSNAFVSSHGRQPPWLPVGRWRWCAWTACVVVLLVSVVLPLGVLAKEAGGIGAYAQALKTAWPELAHTLLVGALSATAMTLLALPLAYVASRGRGWRRSVVDYAPLLTFAVPGTVLGIGLIRLWNRGGAADWVYGTVAVVVFACIARFMAVAHRGAAVALGQIDPSLEDAAAVSGVSWLRTGTGVVLPLVWRPLVGVWVVVFILSVGELSASILVCPAGFNTITTRMFSLMHYGMNQLVAALAIMLVVCILAPLMVLAVAMRRYLGNAYA